MIRQFIYNELKYTFLKVYQNRFHDKEDLEIMATLEDKQAFCENALMNSIYKLLFWRNYGQFYLYRIWDPDLLTYWKPLHLSWQQHNNTNIYIKIKFFTTSRYLFKPDCCLWLVGSYYTNSLQRKFQRWFLNSS